MRGWILPLVCGLLLVGGVAACAPSPVDPTEDCTASSEPPPGEPGSAEILLRVSTGAVLYADGWMVVSADDDPGAAVNAISAPLMAPPPPASPLWRPAYLGECELAAITDLAEEELTTDRDLGQPSITDSPTTSVTYYGGAEPATTTAYALGYEDSGGGVSRADRQGREVLKGLIAVLDEAPRTGDMLPIESVQLSGEVGEPEPEGWPGPPLAEVLGTEGCGELTGQQARDVHAYLSERTHEDAGWLRATVLAPGTTACD